MNWTRSSNGRHGRPMAALAVQWPMSSRRPIVVSAWPGWRLIAAARPSDRPIAPANFRPMRPIRLIRPITPLKRPGAPGPGPLRLEVRAVLAGPPSLSPVGEPGLGPTCPRDGSQIQIPDLAKWRGPPPLGEVWNLDLRSIPWASRTESWLAYRGQRGRSGEDRAHFEPEGAGPGRPGPLEGGYWPD